MIIISMIINENIFPCLAPSKDDYIDHQHAEDVADHHHGEDVTDDHHHGEDVTDDHHHGEDVVKGGYGEHVADKHPDMHINQYRL